jgi:hypothetical protein
MRPRRIAFVGSPSSDHLLENSFDLLSGVDFRQPLSRTSDTESWAASLKKCEPDLGWPRRSTARRSDAAGALDHGDRAVAAFS